MLAWTDLAGAGLLGVDLGVDLIGKPVTASNARPLTVTVFSLFTSFVPRSLN